MEKNTKDLIYDTLKKRIVELDYLPGHLMVEKDLIQEFHVSRTPIREVLLKLSEEDLVEVIPKVGIYVTQIDLQKVKNAFELKKNLEALAAELAAQRAENQEAKELYQLALMIKDLKPEENYKDLIETDQLFHRLTRQFSKNEMLIMTLEKLNDMTERFLRHIKYTLTDPAWYYDSLSSIAEAILDRNPKKASDEAEKHTQIFLDQLFRNFFG